MTFLIYILVGLVLGAIAKLIMGESMGWLGTILAGIVGALIGGALGSFLLGDSSKGNPANDLTNIWGWVLSILGTIIALAILKMITRGSARSTGTQPRV